MLILSAGQRLFEVTEGHDLYKRSLYEYSVTHVFRVVSGVEINGTSLILMMMMMIWALGRRNKAAV